MEMQLTEKTLEDIFLELTEDTIIENNDMVEMEEEKEEKSC